MSVSVERLRVWLLTGVGLLVVVIASFLGYARYKAHHFLTNLPSKLGINITQETNAFTYSQTDGPRTIFTLHAAKAIQHTDGKYLLQNVGIILYGKKQDRADRISGKEFEYDQAAGLIRSTGEVHIDLAAPAPTDAKGRRDYAAGGQGPGAGVGDEPRDGRIVHVKTSGLVYMQKLGVAATDKDLEFEFNGVTGHAKGADYTTDSGELTLHSAVQMNGVEQGQPFVLTGSSADLNRQSQLVVVIHARYVGAAGTRRLEADKATAHLRSDGTAERVECEGNVTLSNAEGGTVMAPRGEMTLNERNQPRSVLMTGGVKLAEDGPVRQLRGESTEGRASFDKIGRPEHAVMIGAVHLHERQREMGTAKSANAVWNDRDLVAGQVDLALSPGEGHGSQLKDAKATGAARLMLVGGGASPRAGATHVPSSVVAGDILMAHFVTRGKSTEIETLHGVGHTLVHRVSDMGVDDTSSGDTLDAKFYGSAAGRPGGKGSVAKPAQSIATAVQVGNVVMTHKVVARPGDAKAVDERATGLRAVYSGDTDRLTLTGSVQVTQEGGTLWADRMVMDQDSGDIAADGAVKASYQQAADAEPVHILATRGELKHDSGLAYFYGIPGKMARLWQAGSQVEAPVLQFDQKQRSLLAKGEGQGVAMAVHTVLVNAAKDGAGASAAGSKKPTVIRVVSRELTYSDIARKAEFTGGVSAVDSDGTMHGQQVVVYLQGAPVGDDKKKVAPLSGQAGFMGGRVDRMVATGRVEMDQPGRKATGEQLVYTASDQTYLLTGTGAVAPKIVDDTRGTTTGSALRFHAGDNSVVVVNDAGSDAGRKVRTETQVKQ